MSGPVKDMFGGENQAACPTCQVIHPDAAAARKCELAHPFETPCRTCKAVRATPEKAQDCHDGHVREARRERARKFARTGVSQREAKT